MYNIIITQPVYTSGVLTPGDKPDQPFPRRITSDAQILCQDDERHPILPAVMEHDQVLVSPHVFSAVRLKVVPEVPGTPDFDQYDFHTAIQAPLSQRTIGRCMVGQGLSVMTAARMGTLRRAIFKPD